MTTYIVKLEKQGKGFYQLYTYAVGEREPAAHLLQQGIADSPVDAVLGMCDWLIDTGRTVPECWGAMGEELVLDSSLFPVNYDMHLFRYGGEWTVKMGCQRFTSFSEMLEANIWNVDSNWREILEIAWPLLSLFLYTSPGSYAGEVGIEDFDQAFLERASENERLSQNYPRSCEIGEARYGHDPVLLVNFTAYPNCYGAEAVMVANYRALQDLFGESIESRDYRYGIDANLLSESDLQALEEILDGLDGYPVIYEDLLCEIEREWEDESWPDLAPEIDFRILFLSEKTPSPLPDHWIVEQVIEKIRAYLREELGYTWMDVPRVNWEWCEHIDGGAWLYDLHRMNESLAALVGELVKHSFSLPEPAPEIVLGMWEDLGYREEVAE